MLEKKILEDLEADDSSLDSLGHLVLQKARKDFDMTGNILEKDFIAFQKTLSEAQDFGQERVRLMIIKFISHIWNELLAI